MHLKQIFLVVCLNMCLSLLFIFLNNYCFVFVSIFEMLSFSIKQFKTSGTL